MSKEKITLASIYEILQTHTARFQAIDARFDTMDSRFDGMDSRFELMEQRLGSVEGLQSTMAAPLVSLEERLVDHSTILMPLRERVEALFGLVESLDAPTGRMEQEYTMITAALQRLEGKFNALEAEQLRKRIDALENRVSALKSPQRV
jgi:chromosome segregation ATPase